MATRDWIFGASQALAVGVLLLIIQYSANHIIKRVVPEYRKRKDDRKAQGIASKKRIKENRIKDYGNNPKAFILMSCIDLALVDAELGKSVFFALSGILGEHYGYDIFFMTCILVSTIMLYRFMASLRDSVLNYMEIVDHELRLLPDNERNGQADEIIGKPPDDISNNNGSNQRPV